MKLKIKTKDTNSFVFEKGKMKVRDVQMVHPKVILNQSDPMIVSESDINSNEQNCIDDQKQQLEMAFQEAND